MIDVNYLSKNELDSIYEYRSCLLHGNFKKAKIVLKKIMNKKYYKMKLKKEFYDYEIEEMGHLCYEDVLHCRIQEIFVEIFKIYCSNKELIISLKEKDIIKTTH